MKRMMPVLAAALLLAGCATPAATSDSVVEPVVDSPSEMAVAPTPCPTPEVTPVPEPGLACEEIRTVLCYDSAPARPCEGYFTMSRDGLWGLMRADGTEVLPCKAQYPVFICGALQQWHWDVQGMSWDDFDSISQTLQEEGVGALCSGHGGLDHSFFYDLDAAGRDQTAVDLSALRCLVGGTPGQSEPMVDAYWEFYGDLLPVYSAHEDPEGGELGWPGPMVESKTGDGQTVKWWYMSRDGSALLPAELDQAGWFFAEALAPVQTGGRWAYLDRKGELATEAVYDAVCDTGPNNDSETFRFAAHLQNGYAAVCRDGKWGLLDATGAEVIPCEEQGVAWEGSTLWVKQDTGWYKAELPA